MNTTNKPIWVEEVDQKNYAIRVLCREVLFSKKSPYQKVEIVDTYRLGKLLLNDNVMMVSEKDEFVYHDMIAHVPLFTHPHPKKILIIGGGDGGTAREVLRHPQVAVCDMVEIDEIVVESCKKYIPQTSCSLSHPKLNLYIQDGVKFIKETKNKYDVILVDSTDPIGPAVPLFGKPFYQDVYKALADDGIVVAQGESAFFNIKSQQTLTHIIKNQFPIALVYHFGNMTYPGGLWSFAVGSKKYHPVKDFQKERVEQSNMKFQYYNENIHTATFATPTFIQNALNL